VYWFLIVFVFFSFSATKLPHYVVYGYSPLFILMARRIDRLPGRAMLIGPAVVLLLLFTALSFALPVAATYFDDPFAQDVMRGAVDDFGAVYFAGSIAALVAVLLCMALPRLTMPVRLVITGTVTAVYLNAVFMPAAARVLQAPVVRAAAIATAEGYDVKLHAVQTPSFNFYTGRLSAKGPIQPGDIVFSKTRKLDELGRYEVIYQDNGLTLARITSLSGDDSN
jgi:hypothetical protein